MQTNKIIKIFRGRYPEYGNWTDDRLWKNLKQPDKFKKAFPEYKDWNDNRILKNLAKYDKNILYINTDVNKKFSLKQTNQPPVKAPVLNITKTLPPLTPPPPPPKTIKVGPIVASDKGMFNVMPQGEPKQKPMNPEVLKYFLKFGKMPTKKDLNNELKLKQTTEELEKSPAGVAARTAIRAANSYTGGMMNKVLNKELPPWIQKHLKSRSKAEDIAGVAANFAGALLPGSMFSGISKGAGTILSKLGITGKLLNTATGKILPGQIGKKIAPHVSRIIYNAIYSGVSGLEYGTLKGIVDKAINKDYSTKKLLNDIGAEAANWAVMGTILGETSHLGNKILGKGLSKLRTKNLEKIKLNNAKRILGIKNTDNIDIIAKKYKELAKKYHPDKGGSAEDMANLNSAYEILKQHYVKNYTKNIFGKLGDYLKKNFGVKTDIKKPTDTVIKNKALVPTNVQNNIKINKNINTIPTIKSDNISPRSLTHTDAGTPAHPASSAISSTEPDINGIGYIGLNVKENFKNLKKNSKNVENFLYNNNIKKEGLKPSKSFFDITNKKIDEMDDNEVSALFKKYDFLPDEDIQDNQILLENGRSVKNILKRLEKTYKPSGISSKTHNVFNHMAKNEILTKDIQTGNKKKIFVYGDLGNFTTMNAIFGHTGTDDFKEKIYKGLATIVNKYDPEGKFGQDTNGDEHWAVVNIDEPKVKQMISEMQTFADTIAKKKYKLDREALKKFIKTQDGEYKERLQKIYDSGVTSISLDNLPYKGGGTKSFSTKEGFIEYDPVKIRESGEDIESAIKRIKKEADYKIEGKNKKLFKGGDENGTRQIQKMGSKEWGGIGSERNAGTIRGNAGSGIKRQERPSTLSSAGEYTGDKEKNKIPTQTPGKSSLLKNKLGIVSPESQFLFEIDKVLSDFKNEINTEIKEKFNIENIKETGNKIKTVSGKLLERYYGLNRPLQRVFIKYEEGLESLNRKITNIVIKHFKNYPKKIREYASYYLENPKKYPAENSSNPQAVKEVANIIEKFEGWALKKLKEIDVFDKSFKSYFDSKIKLLINEKRKLQSDLNNAKNDNKLYNKISKSIDDIDAEITKLKDLKYLHHYVKKPKLLKKVYIWLKTGLIRKLRTTPKELKGRKFDTIDDLKNAGFEVETDSAVITARILRLTLESMRNKEMIDALKSSKDFVLPKEEAKNNPNTIDWVRVPEVEDLKGYVVHPFIANAIKELVWAPKYDTAWKRYISKPMRKLNIALKLARFYKPFIMTYNDLQQSWLATPFKSIFTFPKNFKSAFSDVLNKSKLYENIEKLGGYNKDYTFYKKLTEETVKDILDKKNKGVIYVALRRLIKNINPVNLIRSVYKTTNDITWHLDEIIRTAVVKEFLSLGMSLPDAVDRMNMFMGHYNYLPKSTKHGLNAWAFVGNYRISMARLYKNILKESLKSSKEFMKSFATAKFKTAAKSLKKGWWANRAMIKWLIWKIAVSKYLWGLGFTGALMGYRYMKKDKDKIKYVSLGGPVFDPSKILARKLPTTILYNMAALPGLATALLYNKGWHGKQIYNPNANATTQNKQVILYILENFFPWTTEIKDLTDKSKKLIDKILNFSGIAYTYEIKNLTPQQLAQMINEIGMRNDLTRAEKLKEIRKLKSKFHRQQIKFHKKLIGETK